MNLSIEVPNDAHELPLFTKWAVQSFQQVKKKIINSGLTG